MIELTNSHFDDLCRDGRVRAQISSLEEVRQAALRKFWTFLVAGLVLGVLVGAVLISIGWPTAGFIGGIAIVFIAMIQTIGPLTRAGEGLKHPVLEALAGMGGMEYLPSDFHPPVYPDAQRLLFGKSLSGQVFTDLFHGTDTEGKRFALYEATLTRRSGKNTVTVFQGQIHAWQRRSPTAGVEIIIVPDKGIFNFINLTGLDRIRFETDADFERKFEVYSSHPASAQALLGGKVRRQLLMLRAQGRLFAYIGPEDMLVAIWGGNRYEAGTMFRAVPGQERARRMFGEIRASLAVLRTLKRELG